MSSTDQLESTTGERRAALPSGVAAHRGILHCRRGEWHSGLHFLQQVETGVGEITMPGLYYSYLGLALARCEKRHAEAVELCERAVSLGFFDPENFLNLAWARMLAGDRQGALKAVARGLELEPDHDGLLGLQARLGRRRAPVLSFLPREHALNVKLGRWRHAMSQRRAG
jgi:tetratricopeptide (TPR) repeat protein